MPQLDWKTSPSENLSASYNGLDFTISPRKNYIWNEYLYKLSITRSSITTFLYTESLQNAMEIASAIANIFSEP